MNQPQVSVIMAVYNAELFVQESIQSILRQTMSDFELIIVNDASTDSTLHLLEEIQKKDKRIKIINLINNVGRAVARNIALSNCVGNFIAVQDADDYSFENRLEIQVNYLLKHPSIFLIGTGAKKIDENGREIGVHRPLDNPQQVEKVLLKKNCIYHSSVMYRRSQIQYREKFPLSQDYDLYLQFLKNGYQLNNINIPLIYYRIHSKAASWNHAAKQRLFAQKALEIFKENLSYESFNPEDILNLNLENSLDKTVLSAEIESLFKLKEFPKMRRICVRYFRHHGYLNTVILFFFISFLPPTFINWIQKKRLH